MGFDWLEGQCEEDLEKIAAQEQKQFSFETLVTATKDFHPTHKLGEGGFGPVYKVNASLQLGLYWSIPNSVWLLWKLVEIIVKEFMIWLALFFFFWVQELNETNYGH